MRSRLFLPLSLALLACPVAPSFAHEADGDGLPDDVERRLDTRPDVAGSPELISSDDLGDADAETGGGFDVAEVRCANAARHRWLWSISFVEPHDPENAICTIYYCGDIGLAEADGRTRYRIKINCRTIEPARNRDRFGFEVVEGPPDSDIDPPEVRQEGFFAGTVTGPDGRPIEGAHVVGIRTEQGRSGPPAGETGVRSVLSTEADAPGARTRPDPGPTPVCIMEAHAMRAARCWPLIALVLSASPLHAQLVDDFSQGGWRLFDSTPGRITTETGSLHLEDAEGEPNWVTAGRVFTVDVDRTPFFLVEVAAVSDRGEVKLIRRDPYDKRVAIRIDRPGLYAVDMRGEFGWSGVMDIETCLYASGDGESITYTYVKFAEKPTEQEQALIEERNSGGNVKLDVPPFCAVPLFNACSVYFTSPELEALHMRYRRTGGDWQSAFRPAYFPEDSMYRGSIVNLEEDTSYELELVGGDGQVLGRTDFTTWSSHVPIARTVVLDEGNFDGNLVISEAGSPDGWIRYTAREGFVLQNDRQSPLIELRKAKYIILDGLMLRGGHKDAIAIERCEYVRIVNCDIADWGRIGTQRFDLDGKFYTEDGAAINWDSAIRISKSIGTVVERCYIHDPVSTANSWYYSHPAGPQAVGIDKPQSTVLRYNDFVGSDLHRWNDAVEGAGNFDLDGGFNRDADIYGNFICFANDDALEIDGGQTNVRVFRNKFEGCLCGVSIQGCMSSPSYVFQNLLVNMGDERGIAGQTIKTSSYANGPSAVSFIFNNTCYGGGSDLSLRQNLRVVARNNIFAGRRAIRGIAQSVHSECDYNLLSTEDSIAEPHGILGAPEFVDASAGLFEPSATSEAVGHGTAIDNFAPATGSGIDIGAIAAGSAMVLPERPIPVYLDRYQLEFSADEVRAGVQESVTAEVSGPGFSSAYRIAQNEAFDWFTVTPDQGVLQSGQTVQFTVSVVPDRMRDRKVYRGAFLVRLANGYSRPVTVYATTDYVPPVKPASDGAFVAYMEAEEPSGGTAHEVVPDDLASGAKCVLVAGPRDGEPTEYRFTVPADGSYVVLMRVRSEEPVGSHDSLFFCLDDQPLEQASLRSDTSWTWSMVAHNRRQSLTCLQPFSLQAGEHVLKLTPRESLYLDLIAVTTDPRIFD